MAEALAHTARLVRNVVRDACRDDPPPALADVRAESRDMLFAHAEDAGFEVNDENRLFADAFVETLAFGLLLARESGGEVGEDA